MIFTYLPAGCSVQEVPIKDFSLGSERMTKLRNIFGKSTESVVARKSYVLTDALVHDLKLKGVECQGEINLLSPRNWINLKGLDEGFERCSASWAKEDLEPVGLLVEKVDAKFLKMLTEGKDLNFEQLFQVCEHLLFYKQQKLKVILQTRPRV